ncbi:thiol methyltransferase [Raphidocelis subcapitata]|uniref:Thiol methyltransferase n=1 Tax=Raphidocelis subcapitata TaxID=307507 RepID=A0A2V0P2E0_9CHLO|nr:thiol methyltransferase [Raphidocelis subcapitata]|eukprot:GBF92003.1 thiol methyltransferase [Raphidocelis subcapitata]
MVEERAAHPGAPPEARSTRVEPGQEVDLREYNERWHQIWGAGLLPGQRFDAGASPPLLRHLLESGKVPTAGRRVLVPGCGRGYDVVAAAAAGAALAVGLDICSLAVSAAGEHRDETLPAEAAARAAFEQRDFFEYSHPGGPFDLGFDYTFFCALPATEAVRKAWAEAWARLLAPGGELVTLIFPVDPSADPTMGPPFPVAPELYESLLTAAGFECLELEPVPTHLSHPARAGREWLGRWRRPGGSGGGGAAVASKF